MGPLSIVCDATEQCLFERLPYPLDYLWTLANVRARLPGTPYLVRPFTAIYTCCIGHFLRFLYSQPMLLMLALAIPLNSPLAQSNGSTLSALT